jgi:hypothetical protein
MRIAIADQSRLDLCLAGVGAIVWPKELRSIAFLLNNAASLNAVSPAPTSVTDAAHTQDTSVPLQEQWFVALQAQIWVVALQAGAQNSQNASPRISPSAGPRNSYTVALTSLLPFARERRFRSAAVIARSPIHGRPPL